MAYYCKGKRQICENPTKCSGCRYFDFTGGYNETTTNADRIRSMSDEELANLLTNYSNNGGWVTKTGREICFERIMEWLKQPAE